MDGDNCSDDQVELFDKLSIKNKVIITMKEYPQYKSVFAIRRSDYPQGKILEYDLLMEVLGGMNCLILFILLIQGK